MDWKSVRLMSGLEIRTLLRSRRTVVTAIVLPMLIMPLMLFASRFSIRSQQRQEAATTYRYAIRGDWSDEVRSLLVAATGILDSGTPEIGDENELASLRTFEHQEVESADPAADVLRGDLHFYIEALGPEEADREPVEPSGQDERDTSPPGGRLSERLDGVPLVRIFVPGDRATATAGAGRMSALLDYARRIETERALREMGLDVRIRDIVRSSDRNVATPGETAGLALGRFLTLFLFMMTLTGGSVVAMDILAGEKERGTLETLLTTAAGRTEIIAAKQLVILMTAVFITLLQVANLYFYTSLDVIPLPEGFSFDVPFSTAAALLLLYLPLAVLVAGALLLLSTIAKSYKEAQLYFFPLYLAGMLPAAAGALGQIPLRSAIAVIPVANSSVAAREVLSGHTDWLFLVLSVAVNVAAAYGLLRYATGLLGNEALITDRQEPPPARLSGAPAYRRQVWRWWAVVWAVFIAASASFPDVRTQLLVNEVVIFLGVSFVIVRWYGLPPVEALSLRRVPWKLWPLVLLLILPMHLTGVLVNVLANTVIPFPAEQFAEQLAVLEDLPPWQLFLMIAVLPGVCEEIAFRGVLLYGLRRRYSMPGLALVVGMVFGFFHFDMLRIVTTGILGIVITAVALMTGSIFPGILLHVGNNALAAWLPGAGVSPEELSPALLSLAVPAVLGLIWVIWRHRRVYPPE